MRVVWVRLAAAIVLFLIGGVSRSNDLNGPVTFVPWKVLIPGNPPAKAPLILYWIPASGDDFKHSELLFSRALTSFAAQCVAMHVIRSDDTTMIEKFGVAGALPVAILIGDGGKELGKVANERGALRVSAVEKLVRDQLRAREEALEAKLDDAKKKALAGDRDSAIAVYKSIWEQRCIFPRKAREAQRELKRLGVSVADAS